MTQPIDTDYNPNTPIADLSFADWQVSFEKNFKKLYEAFLVNHVALDDATNPGNHTKVQLVEQTSMPQTNTAELSVYTKDVPGQTDQVFIRLGSNTQDFQFTNYQIYDLSNIKPDSYFTFLPGKLICYFGLFDPSGQSVGLAGLIKRLDLFPPIAKNIVSVNFTSIAPVLGSGVTYNMAAKNEKGIIGSLNLFVIGNPSTVNIHYYTIIANI